MLQKRMKQILHIGHLGIERTKVNARGTMYWPNINTDIENMVANCTECQIYCNKLEKETLLQHTVPEKPWTKVATDLFHCFNQNYLILVDYTLKYFEVCQLQNLTSEEVITKMKSSFLRFGIPEEIVSDNGSQYTSNEFHEFAKIYNFRHTTSTPEYPQNNGLAERTIQTVKKTLKKARCCLEDPYLALLALRTTPKAKSESPAFILMKRNPKTLLPHIAKTVNKSNTDHKFSKPKELSPLQQNENIRVLQENLWKREGVVIKALPYHSYKIRLRNGNIVRQNRRHILLTKQLQESD